MNKGNSKRFPQGCVYQLNEFDEAAASGAFICFQLKKGFSAGFFQAFFEQNRHGEQLAKHITSSARSDGLLNIKADDFFNIEVKVPKNRKEQEQIADMLIVLKNGISAQTEKIESLNQHKKGLMQQLFPTA